MSQGAEPGTSLHEDRTRALSFGSAAALYDRARPSYPAELIDDLMALKPSTALDVGCGTGKASRLLRERGVAVLGVEPDPRMAAVARSHGLQVEEATFEAWNPRGRRFDLIVSGQAWHWVDPTAGPATAAAVLPPGGHLAAFWNLGAHDPQTLAVLTPIYARMVPEIAESTTALGQHPHEESSRVAAISESGHFERVELRSYTWEQWYTRAHWLDFLATHSDHAGLEPALRAALLDTVGDAVERMGGSLRMHFQTVLILATR
ncbi:MAG TPA: class I SAM-dependent methyltransferase [Candidatus Dormibacteraeota bacterium]|nr:class I SAM-dependent methyltransferase [Candidatus Dormibacteraeota bacterium]